MLGILALLSVAGALLIAATLPLLSRAHPYLSQQVFIQLFP